MTWVEDLRPGVQGDTGITFNTVYIIKKMENLLFGPRVWVGPSFT